MGLRHRAALGISEVSDAVTIVVSEETGRISVVVDGRFRHRGIDVERLATILGEYFHTPEPTGLLRGLDFMTRLTERFRQIEV